MLAAEEQLKRIQDKLQQLLKQHMLLKKENQQLKQALHGLEAESASHQEQVDGLKQQVDILKLSAGELGEKDKKEFEKKINGYLKEIDRCITLLGE
jgi:chromosome segregation ATPase